MPDQPTLTPEPAGLTAEQQLQLVRTILDPLGAVRADVSEARIAEALWETVNTYEDQVQAQQREIARLREALEAARPEYWTPTASTSACGWYQTGDHADGACRFCGFPQAAHGETP